MAELTTPTSASGCASATPPPRRARRRAAVPRCCGGPRRHAAADAEAEVFGGALYDAERARARPTARSHASLGCGVPTAVADLHAGETVLDLGSGAGADVLISARRVGPTGARSGST